jgi:hypothetical protein
MPPRDPDLSRTDLPASADHAVVPGSPRVSLDVPLQSGRVPFELACEGVRDLVPVLTGNKGYVFGILWGTRHQGQIAIERWRAVQLPPHAGSSLAQAQAAVIDQLTLEAANTDGLRPIGLFRTQPGGWPVITERDAQWIESAQALLPAEGGFFVLIRNMVNRPRSAALFPLERGWRSRMSTPVLEFPFDDYLLRQGYFGDLPARAEPAGVPAPPQPRIPRAWGKRVAMVGGAALLFALCAYFWFENAGQPLASRALNTAAPALVRSGVSLNVSRKDPDIDVTWDRFSPTVTEATGGTLLIRDGALSRAVRLSPVQLREGHVLYRPSPGADQDFELQIETRDGLRHTESVQVLSWNSGATPQIVRSIPPPAVDREKQRDDSRLVTSAERRAPAPPPVSGKEGAEAGAPEPNPSAAKTPGKKEEPNPVEPPRLEALREVTTAASPGPPKSAAAPDPSVNSPAAPPKSAAAGTDLSVNPPAAPPKTAAAGTDHPAATPAAPASQPPVRQAPLPAVTQSQPAQVVPPPVQPQTAAPAPAPATAPPLLAGPVPISRVTPVMTREVREALRRASGPVTVNVRVAVDAAGKVHNTEVVSITGNMPGGALVVRSAAQNAAREWKFRPASLNGKNVPGELVLSFKF